MQIALILTGGTICSRAGADGSRRSDVQTAVTTLEQQYRANHPYSHTVFHTEMPLNKLSEDLTPDDWCTLLHTIHALDISKYDGIIIAHGTDTLDQTAAMLSAALCGIQIPVLLVSAIAPLDDPSTNGHANFAAAVRLIHKHLAAGVWVVYENSDGAMYLHRGFELQPCTHDSMSFFSSTMQTLDAVFSAEPIPAKKDIRSTLRIFQHMPIQKKQVLLLHPYTGLRYDNIALENIIAVVHGTYHSETANASRYSPYAMQTLLLRCQAANIPCYLAPCHMDSQCYGSGYDLVQAGAIPLEDMTLAFAYGAIWFISRDTADAEMLTLTVRQLHQRLKSQVFRCCM